MGEEELFKQFLQEYFQQNPNSYFGAQAGGGSQGMTGGGGGGSTLSSMMNTLESGSPWGAVAGAALTGLSSLLAGKSAAEKQAEWTLAQKKKLMGKFSGEYNNPRDMISNNKMLEVFSNHQEAMQPTYANWAANLSKLGGLRSPEAMNVLGRNKASEQARYFENLSMENLREMFQNMLSLRSAMAQVAG